MYSVNMNKFHVFKLTNSSFNVVTIPKGNNKDVDACSLRQESNIETFW